MVSSHQKPGVSRTEYRITQNDSNVTLTDTTADIESTHMEFTVPNRTRFLIRAGDIFSLYLASSTPTELAITSLTRLYHRDPNGIRADQLVISDYDVLQEFSDRNLIYTFGQDVELLEDDILRLTVFGNLAADDAQFRMQISCMRSALLSS